MPGRITSCRLPCRRGGSRRRRLEVLAERFDAAHRRMYGFVAEGETVQLVTFRVEAAGVVPKAAFSPQDGGGGGCIWARSSGGGRFGCRRRRGFVSCPVYGRDLLRAGHRFVGPAIVEQMDATTVVPPGMSGRVEPYGNLILEGLG